MTEYLAPGEQIAQFVDRANTNQPTVMHVSDTGPK